MWGGAEQGSRTRFTFFFLMKKIPQRQAYQAGGNTMTITDGGKHRNKHNDGRTRTKTTGLQAEGIEV